MIFCRKLSRAQLQKFVAAQPPCVVAMEACASAHHWGRAIGELGHEVRLIPPDCVKPFVKRQKNDMADPEAIAEAASRPTMRFEALKSEAQQAAAMAYRTRDLLVRQRTQTINALRAHLAEQGIVAPVGPAHVGRLAAVIDGDDGMLPAAVRELARLLLDQIAGLITTASSALASALAASVDMRTLQARSNWCKDRRSASSAARVRAGAGSWKQARRSMAMKYCLTFLPRRLRSTMASTFAMSSEI